MRLLELIERLDSLADDIDLEEKNPEIVAYSYNWGDVVGIKNLSFCEKDGYLVLDLDMDDF